MSTNVRSAGRPSGLARPRSLLFAPGNRADLIAKLPRSAPDAVVIDLEDAIPGTPEAKAAARPVARDAARDLIAAAPHLPVFLRVNAVHSPYFAEDLHVLTPELAGVVVPKLERADDVRQVVNALATSGLTLPILAGLETGAGVWHAHEILREDAVRWAYFGAEDYTTDLGGRRTPGGLEVLYARSQVALAARLTGVPALDIVVTALNDPARFREDAELGRALGYAGKLCIHPAQVALAHELFGATPAETARARALLAAAHDAATQGHGAFSFEGQMVDEPMLAAARAILAQDHAGLPHAGGTHE
ncbi:MULTISPECIES: CoA ester lyase [Deinococcus]|jgi:citrate lyase subunit beta/citryl-CoA lyase|uniref:Citrate lyase subunit beta/citryl-CoA lyase n=2 Tax=Deinococcus soli (ex Cha et al. 2016) TaxID=1309411 RepID=A0AAE3XAN4_9DEIO|nr:MULTISPECIES: CoA ester lyase [Deinococcus]MDK2011780.1 CoA ester lyase [Deinococcus sp. 43]MDR6216565.1 citrate lyase subunit beta/citryl-CoA lyase [Deinococcus soli (ex Cha et al. 2016)]MDR6327386.1 citrate lyase subunit beta/citryl-CoA lyase [Deinococcus soli (ex Cha et al. 2016)]MDR6749661.1 citrate lyase subunit beta/citryl-CoA lyase [Deinococcus soli (ex Cha et al. 2016)]GGB73380.1 citrate lyase subunit beta-like protein [Deinococcus soli (ex Cha et al. 2016)]